jgi:hypothetical protein
METHTGEVQLVKSASQSSEHDGSVNMDLNEAVVKTETSKRKSKSRSNQMGSNIDESVTGIENTSDKNSSIRIAFEGEVASRIQKLESGLKDRLSKPDLGMVIGREILSWSEKRWSEIIEENTDVEYFFAQIRKCSDRGKSIKLLKSLAEKLKNENVEGDVQATESLENVQNSAVVQ